MNATKASALSTTELLALAWSGTLTAEEHEAVEDELDRRPVEDVLFDPNPLQAS